MNIRVPDTGIACHDAGAANIIASFVRTLRYNCLQVMEKIYEGVAFLRAL